MINRRKITDCYLCGKALAEPINDDHVPPSMFFAKALRQTYNLTKLLTIPVHAVCNKAWQKDEEYFVYTFLPFVRGSTSGNALWKDAFQRMGKGRTIRLANAVLKEFEHQIGGVLLPASKVAKRFDRERVWGVIWKIIRGLYFHHTGQILPARLEVAVTITPRGETPPQTFIDFAQSGTMKSRGEYQGVFAYAFKPYPGTPYLHYGRSICGIASSSQRSFMTRSATARIVRSWGRVGPDHAVQFQNWPTGKGGYEGSILFSGYTHFLRRLSVSGASII